MAISWKTLPLIVLTRRNHKGIISTPGVNKLTVPGALYNHVPVPLSFVYAVNNTELGDLAENGGRLVYNEQRTLEARAEAIGHAPRVILVGTTLHEKTALTDFLEYKEHDGKIIQPGEEDYIFGGPAALLYARAIGYEGTKSLDKELTFFSKDRTRRKRVLSSAEMYTMMYLVKEVNDLVERSR